MFCIKKNKKIFGCLISFLLALTMSFQLVGCATVKEKAENIYNDAKDAVLEVKDGFLEWLSNIDTEKFKDGWNYATEYIGSAISSVNTTQYINEIVDALETFKTDINSSFSSARGTAQEAGYLAEKWVADTFNIDAAVRQSKNEAYVPGSNELGSADIITNYGEEASSKYYQSANGSAAAQARTIIEAYNKYANGTKNPMTLEEYVNQHGFDMDSLFESLYSGQTRIIPTDQIEQATKFLKGKIDVDNLKNSGMDLAKNEAYVETLSNLKDRLQAPDGTSSKPATYEEMQAIAELAKEGKFDPEDFGFTVSQLLTPKYIVKQSIGTGIDVGMIKAALTIGPDIFSIIMEAINEGNIDKDRIEDVGIEGAIAASEGFVEGSVSSAVVMLCEKGVFGSALQGANSNVIAAIVFLLIEAAINGFYLSRGEITTAEYSNMMFDNVMLTMLVLPVTALLAYYGAPVIVVIAGGIAGSILASTLYYPAKEMVLDIIDAEGMPAVHSVDIDKVSVAKDIIADLHIKEAISDFKDLMISTASDGYIKVKALFAGES